MSDNETMSGIAVERIAALEAEHDLYRDALTWLAGHTTVGEGYCPAGPCFRCTDAHIGGTCAERIAAYALEQARAAREGDE